MGDTPQAGSDDLPDADTLPDQLHGAPRLSQLHGAPRLSQLHGAPRLSQLQGASRQLHGASRLPEVPLDDGDDALAMAVMQARLFGAQPVTVGRFTVQSRLGAGGMGTVYAAHDRLLDRKVALKLLHRARLPGGGDDRLLREAQAMARLSHPNIVAVYEVGTHAGQLFIAMEFVHGQTLDAWLTTRTHPWQAVLRVLLAAGHGLAAAHAAGLVHRDYKPHNTLVGADGSVKVADFGLARANQTSDPTPVDASHPRMLHAQLTQLGAVVGTPLYMAPEQHAGRPCDERSDQFSYCVTAWQALYGEHPFPTDSRESLLAAISAGRARPAPPRTRVPAWLRRTLLRGLAADPAQRWPSLSALLTELARGRTRARLRIAAAITLVLTLITTAAIVQHRLATARRISACEAAGDAISDIWSDDARQRLHTAFLATDTSYAETTAARILPWLDERAAAWRQARTATCLAADDLLDRATWCLEARHSELAALVAELEHATATTVQRSIPAVASLAPISDCVDEQLLRRQPAPPTDDRDTIREARAGLSHAHALALAGNPIEALALATRVRERAAHLAWPPLWAAARAEEGDLLEQTGALPAAETASAEAYFAAGHAGAWLTAADSATDLIHLVGYRLARPAEARTWAEHSRLAIAHAGDPGQLREATRLNALANAHWAAGTFADALPLYQRALALRESTLGPAHPDVATCLDNLASVELDAGNYAAAKTRLVRAAELRERTLGKDHPLYAASLMNLANAHVATGDYPQALARFEQSLNIREQALGPDHVDVAATLGNLAALHRMTGAYPQARAEHERALAIQRRALGDDHPDLSRNLGGLAALHHTEGDHAAAQKLYERVVAIEEKALGPDHPTLARDLANLAIVRQAQGALADALALHTRALTIFERALGPDHPDVAISLSDLADLHLARHDPGAALPLAERATELLAALPGTQDGEPTAQFNLARALVATHGDRTRALTLARTARDALAITGEPQPLAAVNQFLTELAVDPLSQSPTK